MHDKDSAAAYQRYRSDESNSDYCSDQDEYELDSYEHFQEFGPGKSLFGIDQGTLYRAPDGAEASDGYGSDDSDSINDDEMAEAHAARDAYFGSLRSMHGIFPDDASLWDA